MYGSSDVMGQLDRFFSHVQKTETCWLWTGALVTGYGSFGGRSKPGPAHRWSYEHFVGPIPEGLWVDHLCRVRNCVRPDHLEPVTPSENQRRRHAARPDPTHCRYKHPLPEGYPRGKRCPSCRRGYPLPPEVEQMMFDKETAGIERAAAAASSRLDGSTA